MKGDSLGVGNTAGAGAGEIMTMSSLAAAILAK